MKKLLIGLGIVLTVGLVLVVCVPGYRFVLLGALKNERFYEDRPVSYWLDALTSRQDAAREHAAYVLGQIVPSDPARTGGVELRRRFSFAQRPWFSLRRVPVRRNSRKDSMKLIALDDRASPVACADGTLARHQDASDLGQRSGG